MGYKLGFLILTSSKLNLRKEKKEDQVIQRRHLQKEIDKRVTYPVLLPFGSIPSHG